MESILQVLAEIIFWISIEKLFQYTGAFLLWIYHYQLNLGFSHFLYKEDEEKASKTGRIGCFFYIAIAIICFLIYKT